MHKRSAGARFRPQKRKSATRSTPIDATVAAMTPTFDAQEPFRRQDGLSAGLSRRQLQGRRFRSVARGVMVSAASPLDLRTRCQAMSLILPDRAIFSHHTAAELYGAPTAPDTSLHVSLVSSVEPRIAGVTAHRVQELGPVWHVCGQPVTSPGRTFVDLAGRLDLPNLVSTGDYLLARPGAPETFRNALLRGTKRRGIRLARAAYPLLNPRADSSPESHMRLLLTLGGLPPDYVNEYLYDSDGRPWAKPDCAYCVRLSLEYEGDHHRTDPRQWERDIRRDNRYRDHGWHLIKVTRSLLYDHPDELLAEAASVLKRRGWQRPRPRAAG